MEERAHDRGHAIPLALLGRESAPPAVIAEIRSLLAILMEHRWFLLACQMEVICCYLPPLQPIDGLRLGLAEGEKATPMTIGTISTPYLLLVLLRCRAADAQVQPRAS